jgi:hypothetical protein
MGAYVARSGHFPETWSLVPDQHPHQRRGEAELAEGQSGAEVRGPECGRDGGAGREAGEEGENVHGGA